MKVIGVYFFVFNVHNDERIMHNLDVRLQIEQKICTKTNVPNITVSTSMQ